MTPFQFPFIELLSFLGIALCALCAARFFQMSPTFGYLCAGLILSPSCLNWATDVTFIRFLGESGVLFLLFFVGLELPLHRLQALRTYLLGAGSAQVILTILALVPFLSWATDWSFEKNFVVAFLLSLSSTAVVIPLLSERGELSKRLGRLSFSVLIFQDMAVVFLFCLTTKIPVEFSVESMLIIVRSLGVLAVAFFIGRFLIARLFYFAAAYYTRELFMTVILSSLLGFSYVMHYFHMPIELGAFIAGLSLADTPYRHKVEGAIISFQGLLLGLFFMLVGAQFDFTFFVAHYGVILKGLAVLMLIKTGVVFIVSLFFRVPPKTSFQAALLLSGCGEFVFIFMHGATRDWLGPEIAGILVSMAVISMMMTPFLGLVGQWLGRFFGRKKKIQASLDARKMGEELPYPEVLISGFGRIGNMVGNVLLENQIPFAVFDNDVNQLKMFSGSSQFLLLYGDLNDEQFLDTLPFSKAKIFVITFPLTYASLEGLTYLKNKFPALNIMARAHDPDLIMRLSKVGIHLFAPPKIEIALQMLGTLLENLGFDREKSQKMLGNLYRDGGRSSDETV